MRLKANKVAEEEQEEEDLRLRGGVHVARDLEMVDRAAALKKGSEAVEAAVEAPRETRRGSADSAALPTCM